MAIVSTGNLIDTLSAHRLLTADQEAQLAALSSTRTAEPRGLARTLVQRGWLTIYQINHVLRGKADELVIGPYRVLEKLGEGGLSHVFKARHIDFELVVALKVIRAEVITSAEGRQQFLQEIEAMARLDHPNVIQFCDADQAGERCYFAMEFVEGTDLGKQVRLGGPLPVHEACDYVRQAALGLQHAHERNLVHRDIKPVNLFLTQVPAEPAPLAKGRSGHVVQAPKMKPLVKILDWGLASLRCPKGTGPQLLDNVAKSLVGTADYLSPEQARNANAVDIRGDVYSLGCTFYYLLSGQPPFSEGTLMQKILQHQMNEPAPVENFRRDVPAGVSAVLKRMLAKNPDDRYRTPAAVALALLPFVSAPPPSAVAPARSAPKPPAPAATDDTPLPGRLGAVARLTRVGAARGATDDDTALP